jgi:putative membrane-bound dehydrogenase-like protein
MKRLASWPLQLIAAALLAAAAAATFLPRAFLLAEDPPQWQSVAIPQAWKNPPGGYYDGKEYSAWFRCRVAPPEAWKGDDLELFVEPIDDAREIFFNGQKIGQIGRFPPTYESGLNGQSRFAVPAGLVKFGGENTVTIRVYQNFGRGGFNVAAPVLFGPGEAIRLQGAWDMRIGDDPAWAKSPEPPVAEAVFTKLENADEVAATLKRLDGDQGPLSPAQSLALMQTSDDLTVELALADPAIGQPLSFKWDERGRMWVMEYRQYPTPAGLKMVSRDKFLRTVYDKTPPAPPNHFRGEDRISIHEDADGDGVYEKHSVFVEGLSLASSFAIGRGGVWVLNPPYLLFYPDRDGDDVPDGDPEVHLEGFGIEDSHSLANNLRWGPDGWLYAAQGSTVTGHIKRPGSEDAPVHSMGQLIWRYHPESRRYEIFAEGGGNTFGVEIDSQGRLYSGTNGGDSRGFHYVQGGYFQKSFGKHGDLSNPYAFGYFPDMEHHAVPRFTHTFVIDEGAALPDQYRGRLFGVEPLQGRVVQSAVETNGSTFKTRDLGHVLTTTDTWFRPVDIQVGPDGALYVADFYEQRIDHASHYQGRIHRESGRIYRLRGKNASPAPKFDLGKLATAELIETLRHENKWFRQEALRILGDRRDAAAIGQLKELIAQEEGRIALEALWAVHQSGGFDERLAAKLLEHANPHVRIWTVRLLADDREVSDSVAAKLADLAYRDPHVEVRSQLACSAKRLPAKHALPIVRQLVRRSEDAADPHLPLLAWWVIENKAETDRDAVLALFADPELWREQIVQQHLLERVMRRYAQAGSRRDLLACAKLLEMAPVKEDGQRLMAGFEKAFEGRPLANLPEELIEAIAQVGGVSLELRLRKGETEAIAEALQLAGDEKVDPRRRVAVLDVFGQVKQPGCVPVVLSVVEQSKNDAVRTAALTALQTYPDTVIAERIIRLHDALPPDLRETAQSVLASRLPWSVEFLRALEAGKVNKELVPLPLVRKLLLHNDDSIAALVQKTFGDVEGASTGEMRERIRQLSAVIAEASGNPYHGKELFLQNCGKCHILFGQGGQIGPDLTSYKRDDLQAMLVNVVNPSAEIREGYENFLAVTADGRQLSGFIAERDNRVVVLRTADGQTITLAQDDLEELRAIPRSVMPEGALDNFDAQQIRDLFAYLRATQPLP